MKVVFLRDFWKRIQENQYIQENQIESELTVSLLDLLGAPFTGRPVESLAGLDDPVEGADNLEQGGVRVGSVSEDDINYVARDL